MKRFVPPDAVCEKIVALLICGYDDEDTKAVAKAVRLWARWYETKYKLVWCRDRLPVDDKGNQCAAMCSESGELELVHPSYHKKLVKRYRGSGLQTAIGLTKPTWVKNVLHELGHLVTWAYPETRADAMANDVYRAAMLRLE